MMVRFRVGNSLASHRAQEYGAMGMGPWVWGHGYGATGTVQAWCHRYGATGQGRGRWLFGTRGLGPIQGYDFQGLCQGTRGVRDAG